LLTENQLTTTKSKINVIMKLIQLFGNSLIVLSAAFALSTFTISCKKADEAAPPADEPAPAAAPAAEPAAPAAAEEKKEG
jgi:hypothetical protein